MYIDFAGRNHFQPAMLTCPPTRRTDVAEDAEAEMEGGAAPAGEEAEGDAEAGEDGEYEGAPMVTSQSSPRLSGRNERCHRCANVAATVLLARKRNIQGLQMLAML